jgi:hypothetical protein
MVKLVLCSKTMVKCEVLIIDDLPYLHSTSRSVSFCVCVCVHCGCGGGSQCNIMDWLAAWLAVLFARHK